MTQFSLENIERTPAGNDVEKGLRFFEVWKQYEEIAKHFNDLLIRLRIQALGGAAALAALAAIIIRGDLTSSLRWGVLVAAFSLLTFFWVAVWILDARYYNRLLYGAVNAILELEQLSKEGKPPSCITLSTQIEEAVERGPKTRPNHTRIPVHRFYAVVMFALLCGLGVSGMGWTGIISQVVVKPGVSGTVLDAKTSLPIAEASVQLLTRQDRALKGAVKTDSDGIFNLWPRKLWHLEFGGEPGESIQFLVAVTKTGYQPFEFILSSSPQGPETRVIKEIRLQPLK